jgi:beta-lactamase regulating signal transducer with metallopeptidase domain
MENKHVGWMLVGLSFVIGLIIFIFNAGLRNIVAETCSHGPTCTMYDTISMQTWLSVAIASIILIIGIMLIFVKPKERIITQEKVIVKTLQPKKKKLDLTGLDEQEKKVISMLQEENGAIFQADLMEKLGIGKVGMTRMLDKLEAKQLVERKRRGMNNVIVLRN